MVAGAPVGVAAELTEVRQPAVGVFDGLAHPERDELLGLGGAGGADLGTDEVVDTGRSDEAAYDAVVVAPVEVEGVAVGEQTAVGCVGEGGLEQDAVVAVGAVARPADRDAVAVGYQGPLPAAFAPRSTGAWAGTFAAGGCLVLAAVDGAVAQIEPDDASQAVRASSATSPNTSAVSHSSRRARSVVSDTAVQEPLDMDPRAAGD
jgi:hypothetical protein